MRARSVPTYTVFVAVTMQGSGQLCCGSARGHQPRDGFHVFSAGPSKRRSSTTDWKRSCSCLSFSCIASNGNLEGSTKPSCTRLTGIYRGSFWRQQRSFVCSEAFALPTSVSPTIFIENLCYFVLPITGLWHMMARRAQRGVEARLQNQCILTALSGGSFMQ